MRIRREGGSGKRTEQRGYTMQRKARPRSRKIERKGQGAAAKQKGEKEVASMEGVENERCLFITNYLNGSDFGGPAGRLTSKWRVR